MAFGFGVSVTVQRQGEDKWGGFTTVSEHTVDGCAFNLTGTDRGTGGPASEASFQRDTVTRAAQLFVPPGADIVPDDRILDSQGHRWMVVGYLSEPVNPFTGWAPGGVASLQEVTG